ncbi:MAG: tRNA pseudouridine(13) synthase TruD [Arenicellales bacterium]|nr:tRNA pseudouridine(13) synthase TruD [Arenicellales bacterium]
MLLPSLKAADSYLAIVSNEFPRLLQRVDLHALLKATPEDFQVDEVLGFSPTGSGSHCLLQIEKVDRNSADVARDLACCLFLSLREIGYCGLKDRRARTRQWFSVPASALTGAKAVPVGAGWLVLQQVRHARKLRRGSHRANRFSIRLHGFTGSASALERRIAQVTKTGFPNYFGEQRFGIERANIDKARLLLAGKAASGKTRFREPRAGLLLSAARSWLFNQVLAHRLQDDTWNTPLPGDLMMLDGSRAFFETAAADPALPGRLARHDIHVSGPLWGQLADAPLPAWQRERQWLSAESQLCTDLERCGVAPGRRALRARAEELTVDWSEPAAPRLGFTLARGSYATVLVHELVDTSAAPRVD